MKFGTILIDPPWPYSRTSNNERLSGYADKQYPLMTSDDIRNMPISSLAADDSVLLVWATWPFIETALSLIRDWEFNFVTGLPWVKVTSLSVSLDGGLEMRPSYGVGYWFRGCSEPLLLAKRGKSVRTQFVGLLSGNARHSKKPASIYALAEQFPAPRLELFARENRPGWHQVGNALDGRDINEGLSELCCTTRQSGL